ncbi:MAG: DUF1961 family protein, partial [Planctomycetota bacterium]
YMTVSPKECLLFLSAQLPEVNASNHQDRSFMARTMDSGKTFQFISWITGDPVNQRSVTPSTVRISPTQLVSITRRKTRNPDTRKYINWLEASVSHNNGGSWMYLSKVADTDRGEENGNPPALVRLRDGRLVVAYGYRSTPLGMRAKISKDDGATWGKVITLREDAGRWDLGYPRMVQRPDGKLVTVYYYNTKQEPEPYIVATIWDPDSVEEKFVKGKLLYQTSMSSPDSVKNWRMEGPGKLEFKDGWMHMYSPDEKMHHVFWCPNSFPESFIAEWDAQNMETDAGLCIIFFAAKGEKGQDIFDPNLPVRTGIFSQYTLGKIVSYHISYYANTPGNPDRPHANLRKNNKFILVQKGKRGIPAKSRKIHKIRLIKDGSHIIMLIDDRKIIDWTDDGREYGPVRTDGKIGFRQMKWTHFKYRNLKIWALEKKKDNAD